MSLAKKNNIYTENGEPKRVRCFMFKQEPKPFFDYITVVYTYAHLFGYPGRVFYRSMSADPFHPLGFGQGGDMPKWNFKPGGSRITFSELPEPCQRLVMQDYEEIWGVCPISINN